MGYSDINSFSKFYSAGQVFWFLLDNGKLKNIFYNTFYIFEYLLFYA